MVAGPAGYTLVLGAGDPDDQVARMLVQLFDAMMFTFRTALIHLPNVDVMPLPVMLAVWQAVNDRDSQLRMLVRADEPEAVETPLVEPVTTEKPGTGLKSQYLQRYEKGSDLTAVVNYAWRVEELETDLRVFTACGDLGRPQAAMPAIDELIQAISIEPR